MSEEWKKCWTTHTIGLVNQANHLYLSFYIIPNLHRICKENINSNIILSLAAVTEIAAPYLSCT